MAISLSDAVNGITEFDGNMRNLESFINSCNLYNTIIPVDHRASLLSVIKSKIIGDAYNKVQPLDDINNWDALKRRLRDKLRKTVSFEYAQQDLSGVFQQGKESVDQFGERVKGKLRVLNDTTRNMSNNENELAILRKANEKLAIAKFEQNLNKESVRILTSAANKDSLDEAIAYAMQKELVLKTKNTVKCDFCGMTNHDESTCRRKKNENNRKPWKPNKEPGNETRGEEEKPSTSTSYARKTEENGKPFIRNNGNNRNGKNNFPRNIRNIENDSDKDSSQDTLENALKNESKN